MTSTEEINMLIGVHTDLKQYYEGIRGRINADLNAAEKRVGDTYRRFWVAAANGDDSANGSQDAPFKTLQEAANRSVWGGYLDIILMSDYHMDKSVSFRTGDIRMRSDSTVNRQITFSDQGDENGYAQRFSSPLTAGSFDFRNITFVSRKMASEVTRKHMIAVHGLTVATFIDCEFEVPNGANLSVFQYAHGLGFTLQTSIYSPEMAGLWIEGVAAGTDPATIKRLAFTNLTSL